MIYDKAHELARALKQSPEYQEFKKAQKLVEQNQESHKMLKDFQTKQMELQSMQLLGQEIPAEKKQEYEKMMELLSLNPAISSYLQAEYQLGRIMADIQKILADALELKGREEGAER